MIAAADLKAGDKVAIHVRAKAGSTLGQVEGTPAAKVAEHEPASTGLIRSRQEARPVGAAR